MTVKVNSFYNALFKYGAFASITILAILVITLISQLLSFLFTDNILFTFFDNWLTRILKLSFGLSKDNLLLYSFNPFDFIILILTGFIIYAISFTFNKTRKVVSLFASAMLFVGIIILIITHLAGRSSLMASVLICSICMINNRHFNNFIVISGILSGILLLLGDITLGVLISLFISILFLFGYLILILWYFLVAKVLYKVKLAD